MVTAMVASALLAAGCGGHGPGDARPPATTTTAERRAAAVAELRADLELLLSPELTCPRPTPAEPFPGEEPVATMLEILGLAPTDPSSCSEGDQQP